jgi:transposase
MPGGGSISPLEEHAQQIFGLIAEQPDLTLDEMVRVLRKQRTPASRSALSRFFGRHDITVKKKPYSSRAQARRRGSGAAALDARARVV